jgi:hypothetical protein
MPSVKIVSSERAEVGTTHIITLLALDASGDPEAVAPTVLVSDVGTTLYWGGENGWVIAANAQTGVVASDNMTGLYKVEISIPSTERVLYVYATSGSVSGKTEAQALLTRYRTVNEPVADAAFGAADAVDTVGKVMSAMRASTTGDQVIDDAAKQMKVFKADGATPALTFNLLDSAGLASAREIWKKVRA